jgi:hypothetical protein
MAMRFLAIFDFDVGTRRAVPFSVIACLFQNYFINLLCPG